MKKLLIGLLAIGSFSSFANIHVECDILSANKVVSSCSTTVSSAGKDGEIKLDSRQSVDLSSLDNCLISISYDLTIKNTTKTNELKKNATEFEKIVFDTNQQMKAEKFKFSIVNYKIKKNKRKRIKIRQSQVLEDHSFAQVSGRVSYVANGSGISCNMKND
jgi:hypothetical protein